MQEAEAPSGSIDVGQLLDFGPWTIQQKVILVLAALAVIFDGMDIQMMGFAIPAIAKDWGIARSSFASALGAGLFGMTIGTAIGGYIGDRLGRRPALLISLFLLASGTLAIATAHSMTSILVLRFIAGLGIGGALPNAATMTAEFTPTNRRPLAVTLTIVCVPLGGLLAGLLASRILIAHGWRLLFVAGGLVPLGLLVILALWLPESPRFLAKDPARTPELRIVLKRISQPIPDGAIILRPSTSANPGKVSLKDLFSDGLALNTLCLWTAFFLCLTTVYLAFNWLPSVLAGSGFSLKQSIEGLSYYNLGGILGTLAFGFWINAKGSRIPMLVGAACAVLSAAISALLLYSHLGPSLALFAAITAHGLFVNAIQTTLYALAAQLYTTRIRATGIAAAIAIGRTGAIGSAFLGGFTLKLQPSVYFAILAIGMAGVFVALAVMKRHITAPFA